MWAPQSLSVSSAPYDCVLCEIAVMRLAELEKHWRACISLQVIGLKLNVSAEVTLYSARFIVLSLATAHSSLCSVSEVSSSSKTNVEYLHYWATLHWNISKKSTGKMFQVIPEKSNSHGNDLFLHVIVWQPLYFLRSHSLHCLAGRYPCFPCQWKANALTDIKMSTSQTALQ